MSTEPKFSAPDANGWMPIETAPKDQQILIYLTARGELGECHWSPAEFDYEESLWWDVANDDECCPKWWLPRSALPAVPVQS